MTIRNNWLNLGLLGKILPGKIIYNLNLGRKVWRNNWKEKE
jgi:hypothetical protein